MLTLNVTQQDDPAFITMASQLLNGAINSYRPAEISIVMLDGCFDYKWEAFSGVINLQLGTWAGPLLRVPPFHPNRVISELCWRRTSTHQFDYEIMERLPLHIHQSGKRNFHRRLKPGFYFWYSSNTQHQNQASMMAYNIEEKTQSHWYISFLKSNDWKINKTHNISRQEVLGLMQSVTTN